MYDYLVVGAGLFGAVFAYEATKAGKRVLVIDKREHIGGNLYTKNTDGINVHVYGAHIFHTSDKAVWDYINSFAEFNRYTNSPVAIYKDEIYNLPFNMNTFSKLWGVKTPKEAMEKINEQIKDVAVDNPRNLEEQALSLVGRDIYEKLIKGYTAKQWGKLCTELPPFIIKRLPVRFTYDNNYFNDTYQGIPVGGYTRIIEKMLSKADVILNKDFFEDKDELSGRAKKIIFTGMIDKYYDYIYGRLEYRSLRFETEIYDMDNYQGNAVVNYTDYDVPYTRIIEHKHFELMCNSGKSNISKTVVTREYPDKWSEEKEPYYPVNDDKNTELYKKYLSLAQADKKVIFGGRLGLYRYMDMHVTLKEALACAKENI